MRFSVLTLFPEMFCGFLEASMVKRGLERGLFAVDLVQIRDFAPEPHRQVDDAPFGGGPGMVMKVDCLARALDAVVTPQTEVVYLTPQGLPFTQESAAELSNLEHVVLLCGHYEGIDERIVASRVDREYSSGDVVLTGGELPAMMIVDAVSRLLPGVLGDPESAACDSFQHGLLDHPHYTRPASWSDGRGGKVEEVPEVLRSGDHGRIAAWRRRQALLRTLIRRPDLLGQARLTRHEQRLLEALRRELDAEEPLDR
ncbi:MAG: tRNA (guanosine(37)-N1)-methyltransferase TrmD [Magnetococcales bacterium]|nr:tRNA (guanosine(37)-N1)-methyltransferase TrmD [Magnetococcales bacterium]